MSGPCFCHPQQPHPPHPPHPHHQNHQQLDQDKPGRVFSQQKNDGGMEKERTNIKPTNIVIDNEACDSTEAEPPSMTRTSSCLE